MIAFVRMDNFGIALEREDNPALRDRPLALLFSEGQPVVTEASAEALAVRPGMRWEAAREACPGLARLTARPQHYAAVAARLLDALDDISPDREAFAPGEAFLDLTACQAYHRHDPRRMGQRVLQLVAAAGGPPCAVGIAGDKTTARVAAQAAAAGEVRVVAPEQAAAWLAPLTLEQLCGVGPGVTEWLASHGVTCCGDLQRLPVAVPAQRFGNHGRRLWLMAQGQDPVPVRPRAESAGPWPPLGRLLPPGRQDAEALLAAFRGLSGKLALRLQREAWPARELRVGLRAPEGWRFEWAALAATDADGLFAPCRRFLRRNWFGEEVRQLQLLPAPERAEVLQPDFFARRRSGGTEPAGRKFRG